MKKILLILSVFFLFLCFEQGISGQVVNRELLVLDHSGSIMNSVNFEGKELVYNFRYQNMEKGSYFAENEAIQKIFYELDLSVDGKIIGTYEVLIRDLIVTMYMEIKMTKGDDFKVISPIYNKTNKWLKLKAVMHDNCKNPDYKWSRLNEVQSFQQLLDHIISDIDKNVKLDCYSM